MWQILERKSIHMGSADGYIFYQMSQGQILSKKGLLKNQGKWTDTNGKIVITGISVEFLYGE